MEILWVFQKGREKFNIFLDLKQIEKKQGFKAPSCACYLSFVKNQKFGLF